MKLTFTVWDVSDRVFNTAKRLTMSVGEDNGFRWGVICQNKWHCALASNNCCTIDVYCDMISLIRGHCVLDFDHHAYLDLFVCRREAVCWCIWEGLIWVWKLLVKGERKNQYWRLVKLLWMMANSGQRSGIKYSVSNMQSKGCCLQHTLNRSTWKSGVYSKLNCYPVMMINSHTGR